MPDKSYVILSPGFPENEADTACLPPVQQFLMAAKAAAPDARFTVIAFQYPFQRKKYLWNGIPVIALGGANRGKAARLLTWLRAWRELNRLKQAGSISGMLSLWLTECALVGKYYGRLFHVAHVTWLQGQDARAKNRYVRWIRPKGSELIAISEFNRRQIAENHGIEPEHVAENGIRPQVFPELNTQRDIDILGVGALIPLKRYDHFLQLVAALKQSRPDIRCVIAGEGPEREKLQQMIAELGLMANVSLAGKLAHPAVLDLMNRSRVLLHPSAYEGSPTVIAEALYAGCKVVAALQAGASQAKNAFVETDPHQMQHRLEELLSAPPHYERVLWNDMEGTALKILSILSHRQSGTHS